MKSAKTILSYLQNQPQFSKLRTHRCIEKMTNLFLPSLKRFIEFGYIQNKTLFFVLNHNAGKQEFDNSIKMIKDVLKSIKPKECEGIEFDEIKAFVTYKHKKVPLYHNPNTTPSYHERAKGDFFIGFVDPNLEKIAKEIQTIIKQRVS